VGDDILLVVQLPAVFSPHDLTIGFLFLATFASRGDHEKQNKKNLFCRVVLAQRVRGGEGCGQGGGNRNLNSKVVAFR
jgi:hypothetical protein